MSTSLSPLHKRVLWLFGARKVLLSIYDNETFKEQHPTDYRIVEDLLVVFDEAFPELNLVIKMFKGELVSKVEQK